MRRELRGAAIVGLCIGLLPAALQGCAQGSTAAVGQTSRSAGGKTGSLAGRGGAGGRAGGGGKTGATSSAAGGMGGAAAPKKAPMTGDTCVPGDEPTCTCDSTHTQGIRICVFDPAAGQTMGKFSDCQSCAPAPKARDAGPGDVTAIGSGTGGKKASTGGSGGAAGSTGGSGGLTGSGGTTTGAGGRTGGRLGGTCNPPCTQLCFPVGILPCCNALGICGCTWAPGAYCL
jgi:hypothetical protein